MLLTRSRSVGLALAVAAAGSLSALAVAPGTAAPPAAPPAAAAAAPAAAAAGKPLGQAAVAVARDHLRSEAATYGLSGTDVGALVPVRVVPTDHNGLTNVYFQQTLNGIDVENAVLNVAVRADGTVFRVASSAVANAAKLATASQPKISAVAAAQAAAAALGLQSDGSFASGDAPSGADREQELGTGGISQEPIPAHLVYDLDGDQLRLSWQLGVYELDSEHYWQIRMDASSAREVSRTDLVEEDGYDVYPLPVEAPTFTTPAPPADGRTVVTNPALTTASPFGWHDTNGAAGAEFTTTRGNNAYAYTDTDANNTPDAGSSPDGGASLVFNFPLDLTQAPSAYRPAAVTNLFYANNAIHDLMYRFGFNEAAGNFQVNNYGKGGNGNDAVNAEAQDGSGTNNANFFTPADGSAPRMQMYVWTSPNPDLDGDFDNGIIIHEYGHGISNRLTGTGSGCLGNAEQAGEGWSDYFAYMLTMPNGTEPPSRGIGTYALAQPTTGVGIRQYPYSRNLATNPHTYDSIKTVAVPHGVGSVWAEMLWEMTWSLIDKYGYSAGFASPTAGNSRSLQLVVDGLKLQPCSPGFVDARNAILAADQANNSGADQCLIWSAFAKRGLGYSASQGSSASRSDGTAATDLPPSCQGLVANRTASPSPNVEAGRQLTYTYTLTSTPASPGGVTGVTATGKVGDHATYVPGSATCGGTYDAGTKTVTFPIGTMAVSTTRTCEFKVLTDATPFTTTRLSDGFETGGVGRWTLSHTGTTGDWAASTAESQGGTTSAFGDEPATVTEKFMALTTPYRVQAGDEFSFWQRSGLEGSATGTAYDAGVVEISTDGGTTWSDIGGATQANWLENGYGSTVSGSYSSPIAGRKAFSGGYDWKRSVADLTPWVGQDVRFRFRLATDTSVGGGGWYVDDVKVGVEVETTSAGSASATGIAAQDLTLTTGIVEPTSTAPAAPTVTGTTAGVGQAVVAFTPGADGGSPITSYTASCTSTDGGAAGSANGTSSPITVTGLTGGKQYQCRVTATNVVGTSAPSAAGPTVTVTSSTTPPPPATKPGAPVITSAKAVSTKKAVVAFTPPATGGSPITSYSVTCTGKGKKAKTRTATGSASPITVGGLTPGKKYTCTVTATNAVGAGPASAPSTKFKMPKKKKGKQNRVQVLGRP